jgi:hypothetical protein
MKFSTVVGHIKDEFDLIEPASGISSFLVGEEYRHQHRAPSDVVFVTYGGTFENHPDAGGYSDLPDDTAFEAMLKDRVALFECDVWGETLDDAETLMEAIIRAAYRKIGYNNFTFGDYAHINQDAENAGVGWRGEKVRFDGSIRLVMTQDSMNTIVTNPLDGGTDYE